MENKYGHSLKKFTPETDERNRVDVTWPTLCTSRGHKKAAGVIGRAT